MREQITDDKKIEKYIKEFRTALYQKLHKHGAGLFVSAHEGLGVVNEEHHELLDAIRTNDNAKISSETMDIVIGGFWMYVSLQEQKKE